MNTLLFKESPILILCITLFFGIIAMILNKTHININSNNNNNEIVFGCYVITLATLIYFYRVPERVNTYPLEFIVAPSDGVIKSILEIDSNTTHIAIYLNVFDAHIQWSPINGEITSVRRKEGQFYPAYILEKSKYNERVETTIFNSNLNEYVTVVQIAGQLARRIVNYKEPKESVKRGDILGMIKLSSRVDLFLPTKKIRLLVNDGDRLQGNKTIIGEIL